MFDDFICSYPCFYISTTLLLLISANSSKGWCRVWMESTIQFNIVSKNLPANTMLPYDSAKLSGVKGEEIGAQHRALRNSTRQRSVFRKWLVYCDMLGPFSLKPLMSSTGNAHLIIQSHQENFMVSGVECSTEVQENETHQVTTICTAQDLIKDTKYGSFTTVSWAICWPKLAKEVMLV